MGYRLYLAARPTGDRRSRAGSALIDGRRAPYHALIGAQFNCAERAASPAGRGRIQQGGLRKRQWHRGLRWGEGSEQLADVELVLVEELAASAAAFVGGFAFQNLSACRCPALINQFV